MTIIPPRPGTAREADPAATEELADVLLAMQRCFLGSLSHELGRGGMSFPQFLLLSALAQGDQLSMSDIARRLGHTTAAATGLVDRLEKLRYVARAHASDDRRRVLVSATAKGLALFARIRRDMTGNLSALLTHLSPTEARAWLRIYRKIHSVCQTIDP